VVYDEKMEEYFCHWDDTYVENPKRWRGVIDRSKELGLLERCQRLPSRSISKQEVLTCHSNKLLETLEKTERMTEEELKATSSTFDCLYIHNKSWQAAQLSAGGAIDLTMAVLEGKVKNGMGILRPPGHHAMVEDSCGYCYLNNVALAARAALNKYENGYWWPNLKESEYDAIGEGAGLGYNINLPLNITGNNDSDYLAMWHSIVLPAILEFRPEMTLISAGYDPAVGCPEGEQNVTPACFAHFTASLMELTNGKVAAFLEGGYFVPSLAEGAALTLRTLLGDPVPLLLEGTKQPNQHIKDTIANVRSILCDKWECFGEFKNLVAIPPVWNGPEVAEAAPFDIMCPTPPRSMEEEEFFIDLVQQLIRETDLVRFDRTQLRINQDDHKEMSFETGVQLFVKREVQVLLGDLFNIKNVKEFESEPEKTATLHLGHQVTDGSTTIINIKKCNTEELNMEPEIHLDCTAIFTDINSIFKKILPLLYRFNPTKIHVFVHKQELAGEELANIGVLLGQLRCLAHGRILLLGKQEILKLLLD